jgi:hypothetical protein
MTDELTILPANPYAKYAVPIEYLPSRDLQPRWGSTRPPIMLLHDWFRAHTTDYRAFLEEMARSVPALSAIPRDFRLELLPEPVWFGVAFAPFDSLALYTMMRLRNPKTYVEIGSGISTCFAAKAVRDHGLHTRIVSIDPQPRAVIDSVCDEIVREGLENCDTEQFADLIAGDILFVDGSHRSFMNSDVTVFMIDVLPRLKPGVIVHVHDITLPWDYPVMFTNWYWNEQYLLAAYMIGARERLDPILPTAFICRDEQFDDALARPFIDFGDPYLNSGWRGGGSMWFTHREQLTTRRSMAAQPRQTGTRMGVTESISDSGSEISPRCASPDLMIGGDATQGLEARSRSGIALDPPPGRSSASWGDVSHLLDLVPGALAAFGLRRLRAGIDCATMRLRREIDGREEDFSNLPDGQLDTPAIGQFIGSSAAFCTAWYDQSQHRNHAEPIGIGPTFELSPGDGGPMLRFRPPAQLCSGAMLERLSAFSIFAVFRAATVLEGRSVARWQKGGDCVVFPYHTGKVLVGIHNGPIDDIPLGINPGKFEVHGVVWERGASKGFATYRNGDLVARRLALNSPITVHNEPLFIGSYGGIAEHFSGELVELVIWPRALSANEIRAVSENMRQCWTDGAVLAEPSVFDMARRARRIFELDEAGLAQLGMDRLTAQIDEILNDPLFEGWPLEEQLRMVKRIREIYTGHWHASGRLLIPALERMFHRTLATADVTLEALCLFYDLLYFLYWYVASDFAAMRGVADQVMKPFAAAVRDGQVCDLPAITPRPLGHEPLRLGYLSQFARLGNPIGPCGHALLAGLTRHVPGKYRLSLYAWSEHDDAGTAALADIGVRVCRFTANSMDERIATVAEAIARDEIDILITDMNTALPTVLFERRVAPVQIFFQVTLPFWPITNVDGVFQLDFLDPQWTDFAATRRFQLDLGAWDQSNYAPPVDPIRVAAERARLPPAAKLVGTYVRFAKITPAYLEIAAQLLARHPDLVIAVGGTGDGKFIRDFIAARGLAGRFALIEEYVDGHVWGHMLDVFLDTFPIGGGVAGREVMAKGRPAVIMRKPWCESERVGMLIADDARSYVDIVSRLIEDPAFYETACTATRDFVAAQPDSAYHIAMIERAISTLARVSRNRSGQSEAACGNEM